MAVDFSTFDDDDTGEGGGLPLKAKYGNEQTKQLDDGEYEVRLTGAEIKPMGKDGGSKFVFYGVVVSGKWAGWKCEKDIFLDSNKGTDEEKKAFQRSKMNDVLQDLASLGFDVQNWTKANGRPRSEMLPLACDVLKGLCVKVAKKTKNGYVNVYLNKRLPALDGQKPTFGAEDMVSSGLNSPPAEENDANKDPVPF
jgi:hypothetical protein